MGTPLSASARIETILEAIQSFGIPSLQEALVALQNSELQAQDLNGIIGELRTLVSMHEASLATSQRQMDELLRENAMLQHQATEGGSTDALVPVLAERDRALEQLRASKRRTAELEAELASVTPQYAALKTEVQLLRQEVARQRERRDRVLSVLNQQGEADPTN